MADDRFDATMARMPRPGVVALRLVVANDVPLPCAADEVAARALRRAVGLDWPRAHGAFAGTDPWCLWTGPHERWVVASDRRALDALVGALPPGADEAAFAIDLGEGLAAWRLHGAGHRGVLARLADAASLPAPGAATRLRLVDVPATIVATSAAESLLLADVALQDYVEAWWRHAHEGAAAGSAAERGGR